MTPDIPALREALAACPFGPPWKCVDETWIDDGAPSDDYTPEQSTARRNLVVAAVNALPGLLARIEKLERVAEAARSRVDAVLPSEERLAHEQLRTALADLDGGNG